MDRCRSIKDTGYSGNCIVWRVQGETAFEGAAKSEAGEGTCESDSEGST